MYEVPLVSPVTVRGEDGPVAVRLPGVEVTVYAVIAEPPFDVGATKDTDAWALPPVAVMDVGAEGTTEVAPYASTDGFASPPLFDGVSVIVPDVVGVIVNVCATLELVNVFTIDVESPPPDGVMVIVPV